MGKGYDFDELFPGRFIKSGEFKGRDVILKITGVSIEELPDKKGNKLNKDGERVRVRGIISFEKTEKQLVLNRTNGECLKALFGRQTDDWIGKRVTFYPAVVDAFGEETTAIRIRGSPDIEKDVTFTLKLAQKKDKEVTLKKTITASSKPELKPAAAPVKDEKQHEPTDEEIEAARGEDFEAGFKQGA